MSLLATWPELSARLLHDSIGAVLVAKWTVVLALAWLANAVLAGRNPRWRVAIWRLAFVGLAMVAVLSATPPMVTYRLISDDRPPVDPRSIDPRPAIFGSASIPPTSAVRTATEAVSVREPSDATRPVTSAAPSFVTVSRNGSSVAPAAGESSGFRRGARIVPWLWSLWLGGALLLSGRLMAGSLALARLVRRATDASEEIAQECREIARRLGCRRPVRVRRTSEVATPCLAGLWRPVLLLPASECDDARPDELRAILAHELAHARNRDLVWNLAAQVASIVLWFHPLAWRLRAAHAAACDAVCDAVAADLLGDVASYGRTLARLAVRAAWPSPVHGLAMARSSDVRRRLDALDRMVFRSPLSRRHVMAALPVGTALVLLVGGFGFTRAEQSADGPRSEPAKISPKPEPEDRKAAGRLTLHATSAETKRPIEGVTISYRGLIGDKHLAATVTTGEDGTATIEWAPGATVHNLQFTARAPDSCRSTYIGTTSGIRWSCRPGKSCGSSRAMRSAVSCETRRVFPSRASRS